MPLPLRVDPTTTPQANFERYGSPEPMPAYGYQGSEQRHGYASNDTYDPHSSKRGTRDEYYNYGRYSPPPDHDSDRVSDRRDDSDDRSQGDRSHDDRSYDDRRSRRSDGGHSHSHTHSHRRRRRHRHVPTRGSERAKHSAGKTAVEVGGVVLASAAIYWAFEYVMKKVSGRKHHRDDRAY